MSTLINKAVEELTTNEKINYRGQLVKAYGMSYVNYTENGDVSYRSPLLSEFRGEATAWIELNPTEYGVFSKDVAYVADALFYGNNQPTQFYKDRNDFSWTEMPLDLEEDQYTYYTMILVDNCWCYLGIYLDALDMLEELKERESIKDSILFGRELGIYYYGGSTTLPVDKLLQYEPYSGQVHKQDSEILRFTMPGMVYGGDSLPLDVELGLPISAKSFPTKVYNKPGRPSHIKNK